MRGRLSACLAAVGTFLVATPALADPSGGAQVPAPPTVDTVRCVASSQSPCGPARALLRGREFAVRGSGLGRLAKLVFHGRRGLRDDVEVQPRGTSDARAIAAVPQDARTGRLSVIDRYGNRTTTRGRLRVADAAAPAPVDAMKERAS